MYSVEAIDGAGIPTGDWETGIATYSAANTLTRTTVIDSSNATALVNFAAGSKRVMLCSLAQITESQSYAFNWPLTGLSTFNRNSAARGNAVTANSGNFTASRVRVVWSSVSGVTYRVGIAPFDTTTRQMTASPTYSDNYTSAGNSNDIVDFNFAGGFTFVSGTTYIVFIARQDSNTGAMLVHFNASAFILYGLGSQPSGRSYYLSKTSPLTTDVWTVETGQYMLIPSV
jgi:hypothetical protein